MAIAPINLTPMFTINRYNQTGAFIKKSYYRPRSHIIIKSYRTWGPIAQHTAIVDYIKIVIPLIWPQLRATFNGNTVIFINVRMLQCLPNIRRLRLDESCRRLRGRLGGDFGSLTLFPGAGSVDSILRVAGKLRMKVPLGHNGWGLTWVVRAAGIGGSRIK